MFDGSVRFCVRRGAAVAVEPRVELCLLGGVGVLGGRRRHAVARKHRAQRTQRKDGGRGNAHAWRAQRL